MFGDHITETEFLDTTQMTNNAPFPAFSPAMGESVERQLLADGRKRQKKGKGKKGHSKKQKKQEERRNLEIRYEKALFLTGYLAMQNDMLRGMIALATATQQQKLDDRLLDSGMRLIERGGRFR